MDYALLCQIFAGLSQLRQEGPQLRVGALQVVQSWPVGGGSPSIFYLVAVPDLPIPFRGDYWVWVIEYDGISKNIF